MIPPEFWHRRKSLRGMFLSWIGWAYGNMVALRFKFTKGKTAALPVICVGNLALGGSGKTPVALALAAMMQERGMKPVFLTRGYKGRLKGVVVDPAVHTALDVGDEPLELAARAPTVVDSDRVNGAKMAAGLSATHIVMDDGFQNPNIAKDKSLVVFDGFLGLGNGRVFPAGPLREPLDQGMSRATAAVIVGPDRTNLAAKISVPVLAADVVLETDVKGKKLLAFG